MEDFKKKRFLISYNPNKHYKTEALQCEINELKERINKLEAKQKH